MRFKFWKSKLDRILDAIRETANDLVQKYDFVTSVQVVCSKRNNLYVINSYYQIAPLSKVLEVFMVLDKDSIKENILTPRKASSVYKDLADKVLHDLQEELSRYQKIINRRPVGLV